MRGDIRPPQLSQALEGLKYCSVGKGWVGSVDSHECSGGVLPLPRVNDVVGCRFTRAARFSGRVGHSAASCGFEVSCSLGDERGGVSRVWFSRRWCGAGSAVSARGWSGPGRPAAQMFLTMTGALSRSRVVRNMCYRTRVEMSHDAGDGLGPREIERTDAVNAGWCNEPVNRSGRVGVGAVGGGPERQAF